MDSEPDPDEQMESEPDPDNSSAPSHSYLTESSIPRKRLLPERRSIRERDNSGNTVLVPDIPSAPSVSVFTLT